MTGLRQHCAKRPRPGKERLTCRSCLVISLNLWFFSWQPRGQSLPHSAPWAGARFKGHNAHEENWLPFEYRWHFYAFSEHMKKRGGTLIDTSLPPTSLYPMFIYMYLNWLHHVYNYAQLLSSLFFPGTLGQFCLWACNGSNDATDLCARGQGTWRPSFIIVREIVGFSGSYK